MVNYSWSRYQAEELVKNSEKTLREDKESAELKELATSFLKKEVERKIQKSRSTFIALGGYTQAPESKPIQQDVCPCCGWKAPLDYHNECLGCGDYVF